MMTIDLSSETIRNVSLLAISVFTFATAWTNQHTRTVVDKVHTIVNAQKTAMMEELMTSRGLTLGMASAMLRLDPNNEDLKKAVAGAQALYNKSVTDSAKKEKE